MRGPESRDHSRFNFTGLHGVEFDDAASNNGSVSTTAEGGIAIPPSVCANDQEQEGGGNGSGRIPLTKGLEMFSENPPVVGYGRWVLTTPSLGTATLARDLFTPA